MAKTRTIKIFDGVKVITSKEVKNCYTVKGLWKYLGMDIKNNKMHSENATEIIGGLMMFRRVDLTEYTKGKETLILEVIPADNFCILYREKGSKKWKHLDDIRLHEDEANEELQGILKNTDRDDLEFKVGRWD